MGIARRGKKGIWQHSRRVPKRYAQYDSRKLIRASLHTQDQSLALAKAAQIELLQDQEWEAAAQGVGSIKSFDQQRQIAEMRGFLYLPAGDIAKLPLSDICSRLEVAQENPLAREAVLGLVEPPKINTSNWLNIYEDHISEKLVGKSPDQIKRWFSPRQRAVQNWHKAIGKAEVQMITRAQTLQFRQWWRRRLEKEGLSPNTANKDFAYLSAMWNTLAKMQGWEGNNPFQNLGFEEVIKQRAAFSREWIRTCLLVPNALSGLNDQAADILRVMINTGARPSELTGLNSHHIKLEENIPHIQIRAEGRVLKTRYSERNLPLFGVALEAMRRHPQGFTRYWDKTPSWSGTVSKYLREHDLLESSNHSPYSLRHALSDRLQNAGCEDRTRKEIMGHRPEGIIYGSGSTLAVKADWLAKVGF